MTPEPYEVRVRGHLDEHWVAWLGGTELVLSDDGTTSIRTGPIDQAQLHGLLAHIRDIGAPITQIRTLDDPDPTPATSGS